MYRVFYLILFFIYAPKLIYEWISGRKTKEWFHRRLFPEPLRATNKNSSCIWVHAVSVGEILAVEPIVLELYKNKSNRLIVSTVTMTGMETLCKRLPDGVEKIFLPFDFPWIVRRLFCHTVPRLVILSEGDVWPEFLMQAKRGGAMVAMINAKLSDRSYRRMRRVPFVGKWLFSSIDLICAQNELYAKRFRKLTKGKVSLLVTGNTKGDATKSTLSDVAMLKKKLGVHSDPILIIASSHFPEEQGLMSALLPLLEQRPSLRVLVVPRHPHRFESVFEMLSTMNVGSVERYTTLKNPHSWRILLVDQMGLLEQMYSVSTVALICGSFVEQVGGHNVIEAAQWGVPCIVGPYMRSQASIMEMAEKTAGVIQVSSYEQASQAVSGLLQNEKRRKEQSRASIALAESIQGASKKCLRAIDEMMRAR